MPERLRDLLALSAAVLLGAAVFFAHCGWAVLIPDNIAWLAFNDRAMHQLGWMFYRAAPWGMPPGSSPLLGIELANSIALVDGLPLLAIPFKLLAPWLPQPFQYWGYWLLLGFVLQSAFAFRIARELGAGRAIALIAAGFALITPAFLFRVPTHMALSSHWVVLAALFLYVRRDPPALWMWPLLAGLTSAIHATLLAMVLALWAAALAQRVWTRRTGLTLLLLEFVTTLALTLAVLWTAGFFGTTSYGSYGYGAYKLNLLWSFISYGWSQIFPGIAHTEFDYEGLSFLGIGIIALLVIAIGSGALARLRAAITARWLPLVIVLVGLMVFAFSNALSFGPWEVVTLPMPGFVDAIGSAFRSTGRFVWPLLYMITIGAVVLAGQRFRPAVAVPLVLAAFVAQAADTYPQARQTSDSLRLAPAPAWASTMQSPLWERAADAGYNRIRAIPVTVGFGTDWQDPGYFAVTHGMDTDIVYLGRIDDEKLDNLRVHEAGVLASGTFEPRTIYILDAESARQAAAHRKPQDFLGLIDNRIVFLRGGQALASGLDFTPFGPGD